MKNLRGNLIMVGVLLAFSTSTLFAAHTSACAGKKRLLQQDRIVLKISEEQWVKTDKATVVVQVDASLQQEALNAARNKIMANLKRISEADWQITQFERSQDQSGLERLTVLGQARIAEKSLAALHSMAKQLTQPGATYRISSIDFNPELNEIEAAKAELRDKIYSKINAEITSLNKQYPQQNFRVYEVNFIPGLLLAAKELRSADSNPAYYASAGGASPMAVSNHLTKTATVILAADRTHD